MAEAFKTLGSALKLPPTGPEDLAPDQEAQQGRSYVSDETRQKQAEQLERAAKTKEDPEVVDMLVGRARARWKIEVNFLSDRTIHKPCAYMVQIWESGKALNGDGDALCWWCLNADPKSNEGCRGIIPQDAVKGGVAMCPHCKRAINAEKLTDMLGGNVRVDVLATYLANLFRKLGSNADIYLKYHKTDPRYIALERAKGELVARRLKGLHIYPLHRILTDISAGADLTKRMKAFLLS